ncbi:cupin domain-containing protein [Streptomyces sp. 4N509B]|uniref:cupin domain-containing protein n=1 Tax=Streptomyces sp. 4N509B TaxID=3457413 RepID=UPI003FD1BE7C
MAGVSAQSAGARHLRLHHLRFPPGTRGRPHVHAGHESAIFVASGDVDVWHGVELSRRVTVSGGDYVYIPPDTPHLPVNVGASDAVVVVARTDPEETEESVFLVEMPRRLVEEIGALPVAGTGVPSRPPGPPGAGAAG